LGQLSGIRTLGTKELVDVIREHVGIGHQGVISSVVFRGCFNHGVRVLQLLLHGLQTLQSLGRLTSLGQQCVFHNAGVTVQQCRGLSTEVLQNLKTFAADVLQILVARGCALLAAVARCLYLCRLGIGLRLWER